jgi:hypothetical protein
MVRAVGAQGRLVGRQGAFAPCWDKSGLWPACVSLRRGKPGQRWAERFIPVGEARSRQLAQFASRLSASRFCHTNVTVKRRRNGKIFVKLIL